MSAYLGVLGDLVLIKCPSRLQQEASRGLSERITVGGVRRVQIGPRLLRTWDVGVEAATPDDLATLAGFVAGEWGPGPFLWVDPWAQVTNLLPPARAALELPWANTSPAGPATLAPGVRAGRSLAIIDSATITHWADPALIDIPCTPGVPVTVSIWARGAGLVLRSVVRALDGSWLASAPATAVGSEWVRLAVTVTPPAGAHRVTVQLEGGGVVTRPAATWSSSVLEYHAGQGVAGVVIDGLQQDVILATREVRAHGRMASVGYRVLEVG